MHHGFNRFIGNHVDPFVLPRRALIDEVANQPRDILAAITQSRQMQGKYPEAVEQVTAKFFFFDRLYQIAIGGGDQAHVHPDRLRASQSLELVVLQNAQQFGLQFQWNLTNLVEQQRALVG